VSEWIDYSECKPREGTPVQVVMISDGKEQVMYLNYWSSTYDKYCEIIKWRYM
jgi:hypothetical protein